MRRRIAPLVAVAALAAVLLAGCSLGAGDSSEPAPGTGTSNGAPVEGGAPADDEAVTDQGVAAPQDRAVVTTGYMSITVDDPIAGASDAAALANGAGGRVDSRTETPGTDTQPASASLVLRIPADELDGVIDDLRKLGEVNSVSLNASDVTQQQQDLDARITALTASVNRLLALLDEADTTADLIAIESELSTRQAELDSLTQQRDWLADQVDYSTITVDLITEDVAPSAVPGDFWSGLVAGWNALLGFLSWIAVALGVLLPWIGALLVVAGIITAIVVLATRRNRHPAA
ncbi:DUF4349 domain-containing protein [Agromyces tardus]|uniref:DUF4349 domain-containing protein n=1 Tax=Agromyces tardus TaxID=2583849 RepID=A0A3M8A2U0_9MICO|nr:DUF4349 domain-containing protein [Agromyces tardus]RNB45520.1 DUF4349 domain-containing protein [Agromyces tardus]